MQKLVLLDMLAQNQTTCSFAFDQITPQNATLRLNPYTASIGVIYLHTGEMMNLFGLFFGLPVEVQNTTLGHTDTGQGQDTELSKRLVVEGYHLFKAYIETTADDAWQDSIETP